MWKREGGRLVRRAPAVAPAPRVQEFARLALELVLAMLPPLEIIRVQLVCRAGRDAARSHAVWVAADLSLRSDFRVTDGMVRAVRAAGTPVSPVRTRADATCRTQRRLLPKLAAFAAARGAPCRYLRLLPADVAAAVYDSDAGPTDEASGSAAPPPPPPVASAAPTLHALHVVHWARAGQEDALLRLFTHFAFPSLRALTLSGFINLELATAVLRAAPALRYLCIDGAGLLVDAGAMLLAAPGLREAQLRAVESVRPGVDLDFRERMGAALDVESDTLQTLRVESCKDLLIGAVHLPALRTLTLASLEPCWVPASTVCNDTLLRITESSPLLTRLVVIGCSGEHRITSEVLAPLAAQCVVLEELLLRSTDTTSQLTRDYRNPVLRAPVFDFPRLRLLAARVTGGITLRCPVLQQLHLCQSDLDDSIGSLLAGGASLHVLDVSRCKLAVAQLALLADGLPTLHQLTARQNWLSLEDANLLMQRAPLHGQPGARLLCCMVQCSAGSYTLGLVSRRTRHRLLAAHRARGGS